MVREPKLKTHETPSDDLSSQILRGIGRPDDFALGLTVAEYEALVAWLYKCRCLRLEPGNRRLLRRCPRSRPRAGCRHGERAADSVITFG